MDLIKIAKNLKNGNIALIPTDTVFGLIGQYENNLAETNLYQMKKRSKSKKFPIAVNSIEMAQQYFIVNGLALKLMKKYWPGPLTIVTGAYALRWSDNLDLNQLINLIGPLYLTSANISGETPITNIKTAKLIFKDQVSDYIHPNNLTFNNINSTIVDANNSLILREGALKIDLKNI